MSEKPLMPELFDPAGRDLLPGGLTDVLLGPKVEKHAEREDNTNTALLAMIELAEDGNHEAAVHLADIIGKAEHVAS